MTRSGLMYVDGPRLARGLFAATEWVWGRREEINRINVFPVPDGDTGTNLCLTLRSVADALRALGDSPLPDTVQAMSRGAVLGARGNSGMMLAHFLLGFAEASGQRLTLDTRELAQCLAAGAAHLETSVDEPREGTILTVAREVAQAAIRTSTSTEDFRAFMDALLLESEASLARTPELLQVLRDAGVVDAGAKGFVLMVEGIVRYMKGDPIEAADDVPRSTEADFAPAAYAAVAAERDFHYCTEVMVKGASLPPSNEVRAAMRPFGGSLVVVVAGGLLKVHVHTDTPEAVFSLAARWGSIEFTKAEDMRAQHRQLAHGDRRPVAVVADSSADLPDAVLDRQHIALVPLQVIFGDRTYRDRVELKPEEFYRLMAQSKVPPTTSQPTPADFIQAFRDAKVAADEVVAVLLSGALSGTLQSGAAAVKAAGLKGIHLVDSRSASLGVGLLALRATELAESGWAAKEIAAELVRIRSQSGCFITVDRFDNLLRSGRVSKGKAWLAGMLDVKPILGLDARGAIVPVDRVRGRENVVPRVLSLLDKALTPRPKALRFGVVHAEAPEAAERVRTALAAAFRPKDVIVNLATGVLGVHVGPGAWAVFWQVEDGVPGGAA
ncbi:MAG: DegV family protein [Gemmatimonadales bacterium]